MNAILYAPNHLSLPLSLRLMRIALSALLVIVITTEWSLGYLWQVMLSILAVYALFTGVFGRDPVFNILKLTLHRLPDHSLGMVAQLECLFVGLSCIAIGIIHRNSESVIISLLPFLGIYPILLCAIKHDLLGYLLRSYHTEK